MNASSDLVELEWVENQAIRKLITDKFPSLENLPFQVALDTKIVSYINDSNFETISILPPFSGG